MTDVRGSIGGHRDGGRYEIRVKGHLDPRWVDWFEGLSLTHAADGTTVLAGVVADQAALHGLLQRVRDLGLPLVSVARSETGLHRPNHQIRKGPP